MTFQHIPMLGLARRILRALCGLNRLGEAPALAASEAEKRVLATLDEAQKSGRTFRSVPVVDGRILRLLAEAVGAQKVVEIGTSMGLSGMWLGLALVRPGGLILSHNMNLAPAYAKAITGDPCLETVLAGHEKQLGITLKKR